MIDHHTHFSEPTFTLRCGITTSMFRENSTGLQNPRTGGVSPVRRAMPILKSGHGNRRHPDDIAAHCDRTVRQLSPAAIENQRLAQVLQSLRLQFGSHRASVWHAMCNDWELSRGFRAGQRSSVVLPPRVLSHDVPEK